MSHYQYDVSIGRQKKFIRRFEKFLIVLLAVVIIGAIVIGFDSINQSITNDTQVGKTNETSVRPLIREFDTDYFMFTAPSNWVSIPSETTDKKFTYRGYNGTLIDSELIIYVNNTAADLEASYVLPIRIDEKQTIIPTQVSDHCNTKSDKKNTASTTRVAIMEVTMLCRVDSTNYLVVAGLKGGDTDIKLKRNNGTIANYNFIYRSSSVPPNSLPFINILNSFIAL